MEKKQLDKLFTQTILEYLQADTNNIIQEDKWADSGKDYKTSNDLERQKKIKQIYANSNKGKLSEKGVNRLVTQIESGTLKYEEMPQWVLETYMDSSKHGAIPLKNNLWLDVDALVAEDGEMSIGTIYYSGIVVNDARANVGGIISVNILRTPEIDVQKWEKITVFQKAAIKALQIIDRKNKMMGNAGINNMNPSDEGQTENAGSKQTAGAGGPMTNSSGAPASSDGNGGGTQVPGNPGGPENATPQNSGNGPNAVPNAPSSNLGTPVDQNGSPDLSGENNDDDETK